MNDAKIFGAWLKRIVINNSIYHYKKKSKYQEVALDENNNKISLTGSGNLWNEDAINTDNLDVALAGPGDFTLDFNTASPDASIAGSGDFHGFDLQANNTDVSVTGSGDAEVVSKETLKARVSRSGDIVYKGVPKMDTKVASSDRITNN